MLDSAYLFRNPNEALGLFDELMYGLFYIKGVPILMQVCFYPLLSLCVALIAWHYRKKNPLLKKAFEALVFLIFILLCFLLYQPWDEGYVNLLHSKNFAEHGTFSFSQSTPVEGTVDFLPYLFLGVLAKTGLDLSLLLFLQGIVGGICCLLLLKRFWKNTALADYAIPIGILFLPILFNSTSGFVTPWFALGVLLFYQLYFVEKKTKAGLVLFSLLPLVRPESVWLTILVVLLILSEKGKKEALPALVWGFVPFVAFCLWRKSYFGYFIPTPVIYKSCLGNLFYLVIGIRNFMADIVASNTLLLAVMFFVARYSLKKKRVEDKFVLALFLFIIPYYLSGGDWFPHAWARYLFPLSFFLFAVSLPGALTWFQKSTEPGKAFFYALFAFLLFMDLYANFGGWQRFYHTAFTPRKIIAENRGAVSEPFRVHFLSQIGRHFQKTTMPGDRIGSSELATIHYFADREAVDFLGITNREVAKLPLRDLPPLWRKAPEDNELPYLIFKRLEPSFVKRYHPEYIYPFDFFMRRYSKDVPEEEWDNDVVIDALKRWSTRFKGLMTPLYGGVENLLENGYQPFIVLYKGKFSMLYFVSKEKVEEHLERLKSSGFTGGWVKGKAKLVEKQNPH